jgi:hypothetical protein
MPARFRLLAVGTAGAVLLASGATAGAAASPAAPPTRPAAASSAATTPSAAAFRLPVTGKLLTSNGHQAGTVTGRVLRLTTSGKSLAAVTAMTVRTASGTINLTRNVPVTGMNNNAPAAAGAASPAAVSCRVLHLVLGPLDLNLLGLRVQLNQVVLDITAVPGAGALLGNLLCAVVNLFNVGGFLTNVAGLLNQVLAILTQLTAAA